VVAVLGDGDIVGPDRQGNGQEPAGGIGQHAADKAGFPVADGDRGIGHGAAALLGNGAAQLGGDALGQQGRGAADQSDQASGMADGR